MRKDGPRDIVGAGGLATALRALEEAFLAGDLGPEEFLRRAEAELARLRTLLDVPRPAAAASAEGGLDSFKRRLAAELAGIRSAYAGGGPLPAAPGDGPGAPEPDAPGARPLADSGPGPDPQYVLVPEPEYEPAPDPEYEPEPDYEPEPEPDYEPAPEPAPEPEPEPELDHETDREAGPGPRPLPSPGSGPGPDPQYVLVPEPEYEPEPGLDCGPDCGSASGLKAEPETEDGPCREAGPGSDDARRADFVFPEGPGFDGPGGSCPVSAPEGPGAAAVADLAAQEPLDLGPPLGAPDPGGTVPRLGRREPEARPPARPGAGAPRSILRTVRQGLDAPAPGAGAPGRRLPERDGREGDSGVPDLRRPARETASPAPRPAPALRLPGGDPGDAPRPGPPRTVPGRTRVVVSGSAAWETTDNDMALGMFVPSSQMNLVRPGEEADSAQDGAERERTRKRLAQMTRDARRPLKSPCGAVIISLFMAGAGLLYTGSTLPGVLLSLAHVGCAGALFATGNPLALGGMGAASLLGAVLACRAAREQNACELARQEEERRAPLLGGPGETTLTGRDLRL